ncbi:MAG: hypothetical protein WCS51_04060 [Bacilli bacterium]
MQYKVTEFNEDDLGGRSNFRTEIVELKYCDKKHFEALSMIKLAEGAYCEFKSRIRLINGLPKKVVTKFICRDLKHQKITTYKLVY